jgi:hypothetical protein
VKKESFGSNSTILLPSPTLARKAAGAKATSHLLRIIIFPSQKPLYFLQHVSLLEKQPASIWIADCEALTEGRGANLQRLASYTCH